MAEVIIQDLEPTLLQKLETLAQLNGRSLQAQLKHILQAIRIHTLT
ncbi:FitA-like ribbon-helix-helix domain-containing protein [Iningainema tapete]|uniref:Antitoxin FitA-like ribbon-helix-helix domain-containing protein n=1 Tax=Iningainema tapete BLCC-T55 TaxID=2748662 RepID=A0A8J7CGF5_9CYAN|nr:hypothetical protein [Iningainema tapete]MBD2776295.1 hypothetical protein [Iningainema tapete BLCC-T55]